MSFRCQKCQRTFPYERKGPLDPRHSNDQLRPEMVVTVIREGYHPPRPDHGDPGGFGTQIVQEQAMCWTCQAETPNVNVIPVGA